MIGLLSPVSRILSSMLPLFYLSRLKLFLDNGLTWRVKDNFTLLRQNARRVRAGMKRTLLNFQRRIDHGFKHTEKEEN
jgi:hypothetical protein